MALGAVATPALDDAVGRLAEPAVELGFTDVFGAEVRAPRDVRRLKLGPDRGGPFCWVAVVRGRALAVQASVGEIRTVREAPRQNAAAIAGSYTPVSQLTLSPNRPRSQSGSTNAS